MAGTSREVNSFSKTLSQHEKGEGRAYIDKSVATTFFGYPSNASRDVEVDFKIYCPQQMTIGLRKDGDRYYFNRKWSQFISANTLSAGDRITFSRTKSREGILEEKAFIVGVSKK